MNIKKYPLDGVRELEINLITDERGCLSELLRSDNHIFLGNDKIEQTNVIYNYPKSIRAWHKHSCNHIEYFAVLQGTIKICAYDDKSKHLIEIINDSSNPKIVRVPGYYWHGIQTLSDKSAVVIESVTKLYNRKKPDREQISYNSRFVSPIIINGNSNDIRMNKPYTWE